MAYDYDLFIIGAGSGGVRPYRIAAGYGARVGICEDYRVGGTCVIRGCVPQEVLAYGSKLAHKFEDRGVPSGVFRQPEIANVGLTEEEAGLTLGELRVFTSAFTPMKYTV